MNEVLGAIELAPHPAFWFLLPVFLVAGAAIVYLYFAQRQLASEGTVRWLTGIRVALVLLLLVLFLQPTVRWLHTEHSSGELWVLVDQSPSMQSGDPQASAAERVRWAEALGYLSSGARAAKPDVALANFVAVASELKGLRPTGAGIGAKLTQEEEAGRIADLAAQLGAWSKQFAAVQTELADDASASDPNSKNARDTLTLVLSFIDKGIAGVKGASTMRDADAAVDWGTIEGDLAHVSDDLGKLSAASDEAFARSHAGDSNVAAAMARLSGVSRADLAQQFVTNTQKRAESDRSVLDLISKYRVRIATFADAAQTTASVDAASFPDALHTALAGGAHMHATNMVAGLQAVSEQIAPGQAAAILILSDGRHNTSGDPTETARLLASRGARVYGLLVGSHEVSPDAAVEQIDAPDWIFKGDTLHAAAILRVDGLAGQTAHLELRRDGVAVDTKAVQVTKNQQTEQVEFTDTPPDQSGAIEYTVDVAQMPGEVNTENNHAMFRVAVKKDKLYALVVDDVPRWEFRYLSAQFERDQRLHTQAVLLTPGGIERIGFGVPAKASPKNPRVEAQILPETKEEWQAFDLIVLGDVGPETLSAEAQQFIAAAVRDKGSTLITIAGRHNMPGAFANLPLGAVLPVTGNPQWDDAAIARHTRSGFRPALAPEGNASVLGQLGLTADTNADLWSDIPVWYWHSAYTQAKPAASVVWSINELQGAGAGGSGEGNVRNRALLATMPYGLGRSMYLAADQSWRLRQVYGTNAHDRFWGQVLRWAVGSDLPAGGKYVRFGASQPTYQQGQPVTITARVLKEDLTPYTGLSFYAHAVPVKSGDSTVDAHFVESAEAPGYYRATLGGLPAGDVEISLQGPEVERLLNGDPSATQKTVVIKILPSLDLEQRNMNTDPALLARVCQAGGGFSLDANYADVLASHLRAIERTESVPEQVGFFTNPEARGTKWAHWGFLLLFAGLITVEWGVRKKAGLA
ncbi:MAG TPA: hypothetical protein VM008_21000 [Phycisphaerae bacterium]|nr:hypothetical protein [Phycisphaerae bacterium]